MLLAFSHEKQEKDVCVVDLKFCYFVYHGMSVYCVQELYKIPKKQRAEERKRTERELGWFLSSSSTVFFDGA